MSAIDHLIGKMVESFAHHSDLIRDEIRAGLTETRNGLRVKAARVVPFTGTAMLNGGPARVTGWSLRADGGPATVTFYDSRDGTGDQLATVQLADADSVSNHWLGPGGVNAGEAVSAVVTGTVAGSLYLGAVD